MPRIYEVNKITHGKGKGRFSAPDISSICLGKGEGSGWADLVRILM